MIGVGRVGGVVGVRGVQPAHFDRLSTCTSTGSVHALTPSLTRREEFSLPRPAGGARGRVADTGDQVRLGRPELNAPVCPAELFDVAQVRTRHARS